MKFVEAARQKALLERGVAVHHQRHGQAFLALAVAGRHVHLERDPRART